MAIVTNRIFPQDILFLHKLYQSLDCDLPSEDECRIGRLEPIGLITSTYGKVDDNGGGQNSTLIIGLNIEFTALGKEYYSMISDIDRSRFENMYI